MRRAWVRRGCSRSRMAALRGLSAAQLRGRWRAAFNPPVWLLWHMARIEDVAANLLLTDGTQVLDGDDWPARLGMARRDVGTGMTPRRSMRSRDESRSKRCWAIGWRWGCGRGR